MIQPAMFCRKQLFFTICLSVLFFVPQSSNGQTDDDVVRIDTNLIQLNIGVVITALALRLVTQKAWIDKYDRADGPNYVILRISNHTRNG